MKKRFVWIKDIRKQSELIRLKEISFSVFNYMNLRQQIAYLNAEHIMQYKLILHQIYKTTNKSNIHDTH